MKYLGVEVVQLIMKCSNTIFIGKEQICLDCCWISLKQMNNMFKFICHVSKLSDRLPEFMNVKCKSSSQPNRRWTSKKCLVYYFVECRSFSSVNSHLLSLTFTSFFFVFKCWTLNLGRISLSYTEILQTYVLIMEDNTILFIDPLNLSYVSLEKKKRYIHLFNNKCLERFTWNLACIFIGLETCQDMNFNSFGLKYWLTLCF